MSTHFTIPPEVQNERIASLRNVWWARFPLDVPNDSTFRGWLSAHSYMTVVYGLSQAFKAFCRSQGNMSQGEIVRYSSRVMVSRSKVLKILKRQEKEKLCRQAMNN